MLVGAGGKEAGEEGTYTQRRTIQIINAIIYQINPFRVVQVYIAFEYTELTGLNVDTAALCSFVLYCLALCRSVSHFDAMYC